MHSGVGPESEERMRMTDGILYHCTLVECRTSNAKAKRAPSGRGSRKIVKDDSDQGTPKKNFTDATRAIASLSQRCGGYIYRTIHVGHLRGHICIDQKEITARRINDAVGIVNRARAIAERATEMLIDGICSSNQDTHLLLQLTHGGKGGCYLLAEPP
ncbi:hypothetical protein SeMB42_g05897 [Synchytrium endobioticum]|uniref:Uncharacterized protein n=1 Tax=Synchytrium endobioticum TaxID=286115 RepID=A0A507CNJ5_9FUNG|nr:hypothetical protein SeMB42_g05897 [Synchytrium endobioticum]